MVRIYKVLALASSYLLAACSGDFEPGSRIASPRILALQADRPYARPGEQVSLTLLAANPGQEQLQWSWATCTLPESSSAAACLAALDGDLTRFDPAEDELRVDVPGDVLDGLPEGQRPSALIGVVVVACPGELQAGTTLDVPTRCVGDDGSVRPIAELEVGIKRILLRERDRNDNPAIETITWDGDLWDEDEVRRAEIREADTFAIDDCAEELQRRIDVTTSAREAGRDEFGADFAEQVIVQFYSTHGLFRDEVRIAQDADNRWVPQRRAGDDRELATLWFIARDDRGGVSWSSRRVELVP